MLHGTFLFLVVVIVATADKNEREERDRERDRGERDREWLQNMGFLFFFTRPDPTSQCWVCLPTGLNPVPLRGHGPIHVGHG